MRGGFLFAGGTIMDEHDEINRRQGIILQLGMLRRSLAERGDSFGSGAGQNPAAESLRKKIAELEDSFDRPIARSR